MLILQIFFSLIVLIALGYVIYLHSYISALKYLGVDLIELGKYIKDIRKYQELLLNRLSQLIGLALWRVSSNLGRLKIPIADQIEVERIKTLSDKIISRNWTAGGYVAARCHLELGFPRKVPEKEDLIIKKMRADIEELKKLQAVSKILSLNKIFMIDIKIRFVRK